MKSIHITVKIRQIILVLSPLLRLLRESLLHAGLCPLRPDVGEGVSQPLGLLHHSLSRIAGGIVPAI